jgi:hypothetical protein
MPDINENISVDVSVIAYINRESWQNNNTLYILSDKDKNIYTVRMYGIASIGQSGKLTGTVAKKKLFGKRQQIHMKSWNLDFLNEI